METMNPLVDANLSVIAPALVYSKPGMAITYAIILATFSIFGVLGNVLIIGTIITGSNRRLAANFFVVNLAICDLVVTSIINPMAISGRLSDSLQVNLHLHDVCSNGKFAPEIKC
jgi:uncharacterized membrane protein